MMTGVVAYIRTIQKRWLYFTLTFVVYLAVGQLSILLYRAFGDSTAVILSPSGVALAAIVLGGYAMLPAVALAAITNGIIGGSTSVIPILGSALGNTFQAGFGFWVLKKFKFDAALTSLKDMFSLIAVTLLASAIVPTVNMIAGKMNAELMRVPYAAPWMGWWVGISLSMLVITPLVIRWSRRSYTTRSRAENVEIFFVLTLLLVTTWFLFATPITTLYGISLILPLVAFLFWLTFRGGSRFITLGLFLMTVLSLVGALYGTYEPVEGGLTRRIFNTQVFDLFLAIFFFILVSIEEQRKAAISRLNEHNLSLQGTVNSVSSETRAKNEFIATLAHELRNPLAPLLSSVETLKLTSQPNSETMKTLDLMHGQIKTMRYLLDDLLDISRITQRKLNLKKAANDIETIVRRAVETSTPLITARKHRLTVSLPEGEVIAEVDPVRLEQIIVNLLHNAAKYTPERGVVDLIVERENKEFIILVRDNGVGIAPEMMDRIFEPFVQILASDKGGGGIGIGLALTKNLVEMHGGTIEVRDSKKGKGTEFEVRIPLASSGPGEVQDEKVTRRTSSNPGLSILVVDDNRKAADTLSRLLELRGHRVRTAYDGESALHSISESVPEVTLLDIGLPDISGYELAERIRAAKVPSILIAVTGYGQSEDKRRTEKAGFDYHLVKPVGLENLEPVLASVGARSMREKG